MLEKQAVGKTWLGALAFCATIFKSDFQHLNPLNFIQIIKSSNTTSAESTCISNMTPK